MSSRFLALTLSVLMFGAMVAQADVVYNSIPSTLPPNVASLGYEATSTAEFGNAVNLDGTSRQLTTITIVMSDWALHSDYPNLSTAGFTVPLTFNLYNYNPDGSVGSLIGTETIAALIPWRPEPDGCDATGYTVGNDCYHGLATTVQFDFTSQNITLPDQLIFGLAFNTTNYGANPTGVAGPYDSLNFGSEGGPTTGSNLYADGAYLNSTWSGAYGDNGSGGTGTFRLDSTSWNGYSPEVLINADTTSPVPEPASMMLFGSGLAGLAGVVRRKLKK